MKKKSISYYDLSKTQLQCLKERYVQEKVNGMSHKDLKEFVLEIISHQVNETIGKEEEIEAWSEMSAYFKDQFETIILEIQKKYSGSDISQKNEVSNQQERVELLERNNLDNEKKDMWND